MYLSAIILIPAILSLSVKCTKSTAPGNLSDFPMVKSDKFSGVTVERKSVLTYRVVMVGGSRKAGGAIRNDLASAGAAHWRGNRLIAGVG